MKNTNNIKRTIACGAAGVFALAFVATAITNNGSTSDLPIPSASLLAQEGATATSPEVDWVPDGSYQSPESEFFPSSSGENFDDYDKPDSNRDYSGDYQYNENELENNYLDYDSGERDHEDSSGNWSENNQAENDRYDNGDYNGDNMHGTSTSDEQWREENDSYREYERQDEEKREYDIGEFEHKKDELLREISNRNRDIRNFERQMQRAPDLQPLVVQIKLKIKAIENCAESTTSSDEGVHECWNLFEDLNPLFEKARFAEESTYLQRELKDIDRNEYELAKMEKDGVDASGLKTKLSKIKNLIEQMLNTSDNEAREDLRWEKEDLFEDFRQEMDGVRRLREFTQFNEQCDRHVAREVDRAKRELSREGTADPNLISELDGLVRTCKKIVAEAQTKAEADNFIDGWEIGDKLREQVWEKLEKLTRSFHEDRKCRDIERGIDELDRGLNIEVPKILESVPTDVKPKLHALIEKGKQILVDARGALAADSCEKAGYILENAEELHWQFKDILHQVGFEEELIDYNEQYDEMYADFDDMEFEMDREEFKRVMNEKRFGVDEMDRMKKISKDVLVEYMDYSFDTDDQTLEFASAAGLENTKLQALIQAKNDLVREVKTLRSQVTNLKQEIQNITAELVEYNFGIGAAKDEAKTLAGQLSTMSEAEAKEEFRKIKTKAIAQKVTDGIIGFPDADDTIDNWFAAFALKAKNKGLIYGNADGTLNPAGQLNYSEAAIAFGRIAGLNGQESDSAAARNLADWAEQGVAALEQKGVNLDFMNNVEAADAIKREEVAILLNEALDLPDVPITEAGFSDINEADTREQQAIANVNAAGIMTGKGGTDEFGIGENLSRAALTKVLSIAAEKIE